MLEEFHGPFNTWTQINPSGDTSGATDTAAIENLISNLTPDRGAGHSPVGYLNPGNYWLNTKLLMGIGDASGATIGLLGATLIGQSQYNTQINWVGPAPDAAGAINSAIMLHHNGCSQMRFARLSFNGSGVANVGIVDNWDNSNSYFPTGNRYEDLRFYSLLGLSGQSGPQSETMGLGLGLSGFGASETMVIRCNFLHAGNPFGTGPIVVGAMTFNFNSLDNWFWDCLFDGQQEGICNVNDQDNYSGDFVACRCNFGCTQHDLHFGNLAPNFASRWCYSAPTGWRHWGAEPIGTFTSNVTMQGNTLGPRTAGSALISNAGPVGALDNKIGAHGAGDPAAITVPNAYGLDGGSGEIWSIGNQFADDVGNAYSATRVHGVDDSYNVGYTDPGYPALPGEPPAVSRPVHNPIGTGADIQAAIDAASDYDVIHLTGIYSGGFSVPANKRLFIEGDSHYWTQVQGVVHFDLPAVAYLRNVQTWGVSASGSSAGGTIHLESCENSTQCSTGGLRALNLGSTVVDMIGCSISLNDSNGTPYGVLADNSTVHWNCGTSGNGWGPFYTVYNGATIVATNVYAENAERDTVLVGANCNGNLNVDGGRSVGGHVYCDLSSWAGGMATFSNHFMGENCPVTCILGNNSMMQGVTFGGAVDSWPIPDPAYSVGAGVGLYAVLNSRAQFDNSGQSTTRSEVASGVSDLASYFRDHLAPLRGCKPVDLVASVPSGFTQLVLINVATSNESLAFDFSGSGTVTARLVSASLASGSVMVAGGSSRQVNFGGSGTTWLTTGLAISVNNGSISGITVDSDTTAHATYTPGSAGSVAFSDTTDGGSASLTITTAASTYTLTGPAGGVPNEASSAFTVALPGGTAVDQAVTITPSAGNGSFNPSSVTLAANTVGASATFTYTPTVSGVQTVAVGNNAGLSNPSSLSYTVSSTGGLNMIFRGDYSSGTAYSAGDVTRSGGTSFVALQASTGVTPTDGAYWASLGSSGVSKGQWSPSILYNAGDIVNSVGATYVAFNQTYGSLPCTRRDWELMGPPSPHVLFADGLATQDFSKYSYSIPGVPNKIYEFSDPGCLSQLPLVGGYAHSSVSGAAGEANEAVSPYLPVASQIFGLNVRWTLRTLNVGTGAINIFRIGGVNGQGGAVFYNYAGAFYLGASGADGGWYSVATNFQSYNVGEWHVCELVWDARAANNVYRLYVDGLLDITLTDTSSGTHYYPATGFAGMNVNATLPTGACSMDIDQIAIYDSYGT